jgi:hypothetical protein
MAEAELPMFVTRHDDLDMSERVPALYVIRGQCEVIAQERAWKIMASAV